MRADGRMKAMPATSSPRQPATRRPTWTATSVEFGPGMTLVAAIRSANASASIQPRRRTISSCIIAMCPAGPPNAVAPSRRNTRATTGSGTRMSIGSARARRAAGGDDRQAPCRGKLDARGQALAVALAGIEMADGMAHRIDERLHHGVAHPREAIVHPQAGAPGLDETRRAQVSQVSRHLRLRLAEALVDVAHADLAVEQQREDAQARPVGQGLEQRFKRCEAFIHDCEGSPKGLRYGLL